MHQDELQKWRMQERQMRLVSCEARGCARVQGGAPACAASAACLPATRSYFPAPPLGCVHAQLVMRAPLLLPAAMLGGQA